MTTEFRIYRLQGRNWRIRRTLTAPRPAADLQEPFVRLPGLTGQPTEVIYQLVNALDVFFLLDDSASMADSDPGGSRNAAALSVVELMQRHGGGRAAVAHWGSAAPASLALGLTPVHAGRLRRAISMPCQLGGTRPAAALARARELLPGDPGRTPVVLLLTDGQDLGDGLARELALLPPGSVHLVLADPSGNCWGREAEWRALAWGSFTRLATLSDRQRVAMESGSVIARAIGLQLR
jgi:hypothetical protein